MDEDGIGSLAAKLVVQDLHSLCVGIESYSENRAGHFV